MKVELSKRARIDIVDIHRHSLSVWGEAQTDAYLLELGDAFERLAAQPELGKAVGLGRRRYRFKRHYVLYRPTAPGVRILGVRHTARNLPPSWR